MRCSRFGEGGFAEGVSAVLGPAGSGSCSDEEIAVFLPAVLQSLCRCLWEASGIWAVRTEVAVPRAEPGPELGAGMRMAVCRASRELGGSEHHGAHLAGIIWY